ncbi:hypothetical protein MMC27_001208 [Xylographa pallens]|nr:hypothetical protein [Xylographa pallens]
MANNREEKVQEYVFVNSVDSQGLGTTARAIVRSHVTRDYHRRSKDSAIAVHLGITSLEEAVAKPEKQMNRFRLGPQGLQETTKRPKPKKHRYAHTNFLSSSSQDLDTEVERKTTSNLSVQAETKIPKRNVPVKKKQAVLNHFDNKQLLKATRYSGKREPRLYEPDTLFGIIGSTRDPFDVMPWSMSTRTWALIYDFFTARESVSALMLNIRKEWYALAVHDQAMFLGALSHYAGSYSLHRTQGDPTESLAYRTRAIQIINDRLKHPDSYFSNGTIGAVASLASYEATNGSRKSAQVHLNGLLYMINARGGLLHAAFPTALQSLVLWADLTSANALGCGPRIMPFGTFPGDILSLDSRSPTQAIRLEVLAKPSDILFLKDDIVAALSELRLLTTILYLQYVPSVKGIGETSYSDRIYLVQRRLTYLSNNCQSGTADIHTTVCIAGLIYLVSVLRDVGFHPQIIATLVSKLKACMEQSWRNLSRLVIDIEVAKMTLWTLVIGGAAAMGKCERVWFVVHLAALCDQLDLYCWSEVEIILAGIVWKSDWERPNGKLWEEVQATRLHKARLKQKSQGTAVETIEPACLPLKRGSL